MRTNQISVGTTPTASLSFSLSHDHLPCHPSSLSLSLPSFCSPGTGELGRGKENRRQTIIHTLRGEEKRKERGPNAGG